MDVFYVAFSGGKDSLVILDLIQRTLPHNAFKVLFGDTGMEFSDTYKLIDQVEQWCQDHHIEFVRSKSKLDPVKSWELFGPPAHTIRWCCSVHKTTPQVLKLREMTANPQFRGFAFTGVRAEESESRSEYEEVNLGEKIRGQYSCHPILKWNSVEVFLYMWKEKLIFNEAYKKGNNRVGCLVCPMVSMKNMHFRYREYREACQASPGVDIFNQLILKTSSKTFSDRESEDEFMNLGGWKARKSGKELSIATDIYRDEVKSEHLHIHLKKLSDDWREWIKTIGEVISLREDGFDIIYQKNRYHIDIIKTSDGFEIICNAGQSTKVDIKFSSLLKNVFRKSAYCVYCQVCEANCPFGFIRMENGKTQISDKCIKCQKCHDIYYGCYAAASLRLPKEEKMSGKSILTYTDLGVENKWIVDFMRLKDEFWESEFNPQNKKTENLKKFLKHADLVDKKLQLTNFGQLIDRLGVNHECAWGLMMSNLAYISTFKWWIKNIIPDVEYNLTSLRALIPDEYTDNVKKQYVGAMKNIFISNEILSKTIGLGECDYEITGARKIRNLKRIVRKPWSVPDSRVILYSLYKFAEACDGYYEFTLTRLMDHKIESAGISPTEIFCLDREKMGRLLNGMSLDYPEFIHASFTHDLDNIWLNADKKSEDVLSLFD